MRDWSKSMRGFLRAVLVWRSDLIDRAVLRRSAEIRATLGNKGADAIHIATALLADCSILLSSDQRLRLPSSLTQIELNHVRDHDRWP